MYLLCTVRDHIGTYDTWRQLSQTGVITVATDLVDVANLRISDDTSCRLLG